jgi:two-component system OmpR family response regulator
MDGEQPARVLIVDDDENVLQLLELKLEQAGFAVDVARSPAGALQVARHNPPEVVLLGNGATDGDGRALVDELLPPAPPGPVPVVVVLSANAAIEDIEAALTHGADDYILKPFSPREVVHRLRVDLLRSRPRSHPGA